MAQPPPPETPAPQRHPFEPYGAETTRRGPEDKPSGVPESASPPPAPWDPPSGPVRTDPIEMVPSAGPPFTTSGSVGAPHAGDDPSHNQTDTLFLQQDPPGALPGPYDPAPPGPYDPAPPGPYDPAPPGPYNNTGLPEDTARPPFGPPPGGERPPWPPQAPYGVADGPMANGPYGIADRPMTGRPPFGEDGPLDDGTRYPGIPPAPGRNRRNRAALVAAGIVAAALIGGAVAYGVLHDSGTSTEQRTSGTRTVPPGTAKSGAGAQAAAVNAVLRAGNGSHRKLAVPLSTCADLAAAVPVFQQVAHDRQRELTRTKRLQVDRLPRGAELRQAMIDTYANSLAADRAYLAWARAVQAKNCGKKNAPQTPDYARAATANQKAGPAKRRVVALWNPIARGQNLPSYRWNQL